MDTAGISLDKCDQREKLVDSFCLPPSPRSTWSLSWGLAPVTQGQFGLRAFSMTVPSLNTALFLFHFTLLCFPRIEES